MATGAVSSNGNVAVNTEINTPGGPGGLLNTSKDSKEAQTAAQFGDVLKRMQAQYGGRAEKPREIKKTLGKDDFLKIMVTQMRHQDPTNPFKAEQMATEMAQFTSVEQLQNLNQSMNKMMSANQPLERMATTNLIGKTVTIDRDRFVHTENEPSMIKYALPRDAKEVKAVIVSEQGEVVLEKDLGPQKAGASEFAWDGLKKNTLKAKSGNYLFRLEARDEKDALIQIDPKRKAKVVGVAFEGNEAVLLIGDARTQEKVSLKSVIRVEDVGPSLGAPVGLTANGQATPGAEAGVPSTGQPNFFTFRKGEGSSTVEGANQVSPEMAAAFAKYAGGQAAPAAPSAQKPAGSQAQPQAQAQPQPQPVKAEGFANGLGDNGDVDTSDIEKNLKARRQVGDTAPAGTPPRQSDFNQLSRR